MKFRVLFFCCLSVLLIRCNSVSDICVVGYEKRAIRLRRVNPKLLSRDGAVGFTKTNDYQWIYNKGLLEKIVYNDLSLEVDYFNTAKGCEILIPSYGSRVDDSLSNEISWSFDSIPELSNGRFIFRKHESDELSIIKCLELCVRDYTPDSRVYAFNPNVFVANDGDTLSIITVNVTKFQPDWDMAICVLHVNNVSYSFSYQATGGINDNAFIWYATMLQHLKINRGQLFWSSANTVWTNFQYFDNEKLDKLFNTIH
jgi:hypothetical protein